MDNFTILDEWAKFSEYDPDQTRFVLGTVSEYTRNGNQLLAKITNDYDSTGTLAVLYAKQLFISFIKECKTDWYSIFDDNTTYQEIKIMWDMFHSDIVNDAEMILITKISHLVDKVLPNMQIGSMDIKSEKSKLLDSLETVFTSLDKCHIDCYLRGGVVKSITNISTAIRVFPNIAHCLLSLNSADDGLYLCYIDNDHRPSGFFGFFIKNNGNLFSVNERLVEAYAGQHKRHRNARYSDRKQYQLFPYRQIFEFNNFDYKGVATKHTIDENKLEFFKLGSESYLPLLLAMICIKHKFEGHCLDDVPTVYVDALMPINVKQLVESSNHDILSIMDSENNHQLVQFNYINIEFTTEGILNNQYGYQFMTKDLPYGERGRFEGFNQIFVDTYGRDFQFDSEAVFQMNKHLKLTDGNKAITTSDNQPNDVLVGTMNYMRLQAYFEARKQLANHIKSNMNKEFEKFGYDTIRSWWPNALWQHTHNIEALITSAEILHKFVECTKYDGCCGVAELDSYKIYKFIGLDNPSAFTVLNKSGKTYEGLRYTCNVTGSPCNVWYKFEVGNWNAFLELIPDTDIPKILIGYMKGRSAKMYIGNPILEVVDPVAEIRNPFEYSGSFSYDRYAYNFDFAIGYSKRGIASKIKENRVNKK